MLSNTMADEVFIHRMKLWCGVYTQKVLDDDIYSVEGNENAMAAWADEAVAEFDKRFKVICSGPTTR